MKPIHFEEFINRDTRFGVSLMDNENEEDIEKYLGLFYSCFGFRDYLDKSWFNWYYNTCPAGRCNNYILVDIDKQKIVGAYGVAKVDYFYAGKQHQGALSVNGMIDNNYGRRGLYSKLIEIIERKELLELRFAFGFVRGNNANSTKGHLNSKWVLADRLFIYRKRSPDVPEGKINNKVRAITDVSEVAKIDFTLLNSKRMFYFNRDDKWFQWRFLSRPHKQYFYLGYYQSENYITGYCVYNLFKSNGKNHLQIIDFNANPDELSCLLLEIDLISRKLNADFIDVLISDYADNIGIVKKGKFIKSEDYFDFIVFPEKSFIGLVHPFFADFDVV